MESITSLAPRSRASDMDGGRNGVQGTEVQRLPRASAVQGSPEDNGLQPSPRCRVPSAPLRSSRPLQRCHASPLHVARAEQLGLGLAPAAGGQPCPWLPQALARPCYRWGGEA